MSALPALSAAFRGTSMPIDRNKQGELRWVSVCCHVNLVNLCIPMFQCYVIMAFGFHPHRINQAQPCHVMKNHRKD